MDMAVDKFIRFSDDGTLDKNSILTAFEKIPDQTVASGFFQKRGRGAYRRVRYSLGRAVPGP